MASFSAGNNPPGPQPILPVGSTASGGAATVVTVASTLPFPKDGIRLSFLAEFVLLCGGPAALQGLTTTDVNEKFVKPMTAATQQSFCEMLRSQSSPNVALAHTFISHAWKYEFLDVVDALQFHFQDSPDVVIWFDLFSNNQHKAVDLDFNWWSSTFKEAIRDFKHTVMVMAPWNNPIPLTRGWCLFELFCTVETGSRFEVAMSKRNQQQFIDELKRGGMAAILQAIGNVDGESSTCFKQEDKDRIFDVVRRTVGFNALNAAVLEQMREWTISVAQANIATAAQAGDDDLTGIMVLAQLYYSQGNYALAEPLYVECLEKRKVKLGVDHPDTLQSMNYLAGLYRAQGK